MRRSERDAEVVVPYVTPDFQCCVRLKFVPFVGDDHRASRISLKIQHLSSDIYCLIRSAATVNFTLLTSNFTLYIIAACGNLN